MITWKVGLAFGLFVALVALLMWAFGHAAGEVSSAEGGFPTALGIPVLAILGGGMISWNQQMSALLFAIAAAMVVLVFGIGVLPLLLCAVLAAGAILALLDL